MRARDIERRARAWLLVVLTGLVLTADPSRADDTEIYDELGACAVESGESYRFIFIVDNSGSMSSWEFTQSRGTINATIEEVLASGLDSIEVAVVQYGTDTGTREHRYEVSVPFTSDASQATGWDRHFGPGSARPWDLQDHQPASLSRMRLDGVYEPGGALDVTDATNVQIVFFTDALRDYPGGCCSSLVSEDGGRHGDLSQVLPGFGEYDALKDGSVLPGGLEAQFTILHVPPGGGYGPPASAAAAAIASPGGSYVGDVEYNPGDPEGPGTRPRRYVQGNFSVSDTGRIIELVRQVIEEVKDATYTNVAPAVSVNAFNELQHRNELYFSVFSPSGRPRWGGNVKKFTIDANGTIRDADRNPAIDAATGSVSEEARSHWSDVEDGADVASGGYRGVLGANQSVYTDASAFEGASVAGDLRVIDEGARLKLDRLGLAASEAGGQCVLMGDKVNGTITAPVGEIVPEAGVSVDTGRLTLAFTTTRTVEAYLRLHPSASGGPVPGACRRLYAGGPDVHECTVDIDAGTDRVDLVFAGRDAESEVEYVLEHSIPGAGAPTACASVEQQRRDIQAWLRGVDVYNEDGDDSSTDAHRFAADPLHAKPFVITYSGTGVDDAAEVLFVTDNLGMLHAIDPADGAGTKLWSYLPEEHLDNARKIILNKAGQPKVYGLDGPVSVVQRKALTSTRDDFKLREVTLYAGERRGGRNYHAIDVSDAASRTANAPALRWKIRGGRTDRFEDLGQSWSRMLPRRIAYDCDRYGTGCRFMEVLVFSGGYDPANDAVDGVPAGTLGNAVYIVDLETGGDRFFWSAGNNADARARHRHDLDLDMRHSMVATPTTIDVDGDGAIDMIYGVSIDGGVWRIDLDSTLSAGGSGGIGRLSAMGGKIADLSGEPGVQRFYNSLDISRMNPKSGADGYVVSTGSGFRAHPDDMDDTHNKLFVLFDPNTVPFSGASEDGRRPYRYYRGERPIRTSDLVEVSGSGHADSAYGRFLSATAPGEKFLQPSLTINNTLIASSFVPGAGSAEECDIGGGRTYFLDARSLRSRFDGPSVELTSPGIPPETSILRLPEISICIGTQCASAGSPEGGAGDDCGSGQFTGEGFGGDFAAAVSSAVCGLETGRAYRASWLER